MRKSTILVLVLLSVSMLYTQVQVSSDKDNGSFDTWRPSSTSGGCHNFGS
ncbi:MAG: hypothetical protein GPJ54_08795, partial [Candidatus Heimdallarchaeota archaeon]|nr:hypothetical protein [Candidatus Heimdallarchaeota archaeon]